jgi:chromosomal replication initiation ATPase DnaA
MSDERILGESGFVEDVLSQADEAYERRYQLKRLGYDAEGIAKRVGEIYDMEPRQFLSKGKEHLKVRARSLFCFWAVKELGMSLRELSRRLELSSPAVGYAVERGETIAREKGYRLIE